MKRIFSTLALMVCAVAAFAGQVCTMDPPRPAGNTGAGFYVVGSKLLDPTGTPFVIRGVNGTHWDSPGDVIGIPVSGANTARLALDFSQPVANNLKLVGTYTAAGIVAIPGNWGATCKSDPALLKGIVDTWVAQAPSWSTLASTALVNIANEWGPSALTSQAWPLAPLANYTWRDSYITAVQRMRSAGYLNTLVIDAPGCGQEVLAVTRGDAAAIEAADPQHNVVFDVHVYGNFYFPATASWQMPQDYASSIVALKATGLPIMLGEFGPGRGIGPSPTLLPPERLIADAEANGFGWLAWAWDDNNLANCQANDTWFSLTTNCGKYTGLPSELTLFGQTIVPLFKSTGATLAHLH